MRGTLRCLEVDLSSPPCRDQRRQHNEITQVPSTRGSFVLLSVCRAVQQTPHLTTAFGQLMGVREKVIGALARRESMTMALFSQCERSQCHTSNPCVSSWVL
jgi:hypothetical protein